MRRGQLMMVVMLVMAVVATIGLSIVSRSITEVRLSTTQDESEKALMAADIGLERKLSNFETGATTGNLIDMNASYDSSDIVGFGGGTSYQYPYGLKNGDVATIFLSPSNTGNFIDLCWGKPGVLSALEVILYYKNDNTGQVFVQRRGFDNTAGSVGKYNFINNGIQINRICGISGKVFAFFKKLMLQASTPANKGWIEINPPYSPLLMRIRIINYTDQTDQDLAVSVSGGSIIPQQAGVLTVTGESGDVIQKIKATVDLEYDLPPMFDSAIYSGTSLTQ